MWELRRIASQGIPDGAGIRSTVWKVFLSFPFLLFVCLEIWKLRKFLGKYGYFWINSSLGVVWLLSQLLLGYLPPDRSQWSSELAKKRSQYRHFKEELLMNPVSHFLYLFNDKIVYITVYATMTFIMWLC